MSTHITETLGPTPEIRLMTDAELDEANGGLFWLVMGFAAAMGALAAVLEPRGGLHNEELVLPALGT